MVKPLGIRLRLATAEDEDTLAYLACQKSIYSDQSLDRKYGVGLARKLINEHGACAFIMNDQVTEDHGGFPAIFIGYILDRRFAERLFMNIKGPYWRDELFSNFPISLVNFIQLSNGRLKKEFPHVSGTLINFNPEDPLNHLLERLGYEIIQLEDSKTHVLVKSF
jgi:hypothetical protein